MDKPRWRRARWEPCLCLKVASQTSLSSSSKTWPCAFCLEHCLWGTKNLMPTPFFWLPGRLWDPTFGYTIALRAVPHGLQRGYLEFKIFSRPQVATTVTRFQNKSLGYARAVFATHQPHKKHQHCATHWNVYTPSAEMPVGWSISLDSQWDRRLSLVKSLARRKGGFPVFFFLNGFKILTFSKQV